MLIESTMLGSRRIVEREATCDLCGWSTGRRPAPQFSRAKAEATMRGHKLLAHPYLFDRNALNEDR